MCVLILMFMVLCLRSDYQFVSSSLTTRSQVLHSPGPSLNTRAPIELFHVPKRQQKGIKDCGWVTRTCLG